ncbi:MAG: hypothetical protein M1813_004170 [Trichoglossum hirsutum]|nr:MAG: hypothetical protein M1813_004170 [Trichoglossum hirsutum]
MPRRSVRFQLGTKHPPHVARSRQVRKMRAGFVAGKKTRAFVYAPATMGTIRRLRRRNLGLKALHDIHHYQKTTDLLIPKAPFARVVRGILSDLGGHDIGTGGSYYRIQAVALLAIQEAAEAALVTEFEMTNLMAIHAKRVTIQAKDMQLVRQIRLYMLGYPNVGNPRGA